MAAGWSDAPDQTTFDHGGWHGTLPLWPFDRHAPDGLDALTDGTGLKFNTHLPGRLSHGSCPHIWPLAPEPEMVERTQATWHVLPSGGLCLLQSDGAWQPEASLVELLAQGGRLAGSSTP